MFGDVVFFNRQNKLLWNLFFLIFQYYANICAAFHVS